MNSENFNVPAASPAAKYCPKCDFREVTVQTSCPNCGAELVVEREVRALASVPLILGASTLMAAVLGYITVLKAHAGRQVFRADDELTLKLSTGIFIMLGVVGLLVVAGSLWQMATGKFYGRLLKILIAATIVVAMVLEIYFAYLRSR